MAILTVGIDLAKNVFAVEGINEDGLTSLELPKVSRAKLPELLASFPPCLIGTDACSGALFWARQFAAQGHTVKLMAPKMCSLSSHCGRFESRPW